MFLLSKNALVHAFRPPLRTTSQVYRSIITGNHDVPKGAYRYYRFPVLVAGAGLLVAATGIATSWSIEKDAPLASMGREPDDRLPMQSQLESDQQTPLISLMRTYVVYSMCSIPTLIEWAPSILANLLAIPLISQVTKAFVRVTFFSQFVGGESAEETVPLLQQLRAENKGALLAYSVEVDEDEAAGKARADLIRQPMHKRVVEEMINCINLAADFEDGKVGKGAPPNGRRTWVAVKLTALVPDSRTLLRFSSYLLKARPSRDITIPFPGCPHSSDLDILEDPAHVTDNSPLTADDITALKELHNDLKRICARAHQRQVRVIIDAEHSWYQPAIDAFTLNLMREFNRVPSSKGSGFSFIDSGTSNGQPLIFATFQAYLRRTPTYILQSLQDARRENYALGVKLVRGAYHPHEIMSHKRSSVQRDMLGDDELGDSAGQMHVISKGSLEYSLGSPSESLSISPELLPPVYLNKDETDRCYDAAAGILLGAVQQSLSSGTSGPQLGILFGTHNRRSCEQIIEIMQKLGLASEVSTRDQIGKMIRVVDAVAEKVTLGQLYGMCDALTNTLAKRINSTVPFVIKYVPYGGLSEVMPYLGRRAIENKSVLGNGAATEERRVAKAEIRKRLFKI